MGFVIVSANITSSFLKPLYLSHFAVMAIIDHTHLAPSDPSLITDIRIDESSQTKNRYLVLGGIGIATLSVAEADKTLAQVRLPLLPHGEMKWGKISNSKINAYGRTVKQKGAAGCPAAPSHWVGSNPSGIRT